MSRRKSTPARAFKGIFRPKRIGTLYRRKPKPVPPPAPRPASLPNNRPAQRPRRTEESQPNQVPGARALFEIKKAQSDALAERFCIPHASFVKVVRGITEDSAAEIHGLGQLRWERDALVCLQLFSESFMTMIFEMWYASTSFPTH
jgi:histone H3/H4